RVRHSLHSRWTKSLSADAANPALSRWPKVQLKNLFSPRQYSGVQIDYFPPWPATVGPLSVAGLFFRHSSTKFGFRSQINVPHHAGVVHSSTPLALCDFLQP